MEKNTEVTWSIVERNETILAQVQFKGWENYIDGFNDDNSNLPINLSMPRNKNTKNIWEVLNNENNGEILNRLTNLTYYLCAIDTYVKSKIVYWSKTLKNKNKEDIKNISLSKDVLFMFCNLHKKYEYTNNIYCISLSILGY